MQIISGILWAVLKAIELAMVARAILSWFPVAEGLYNILETLTEPVILPVRVLLDKLGISLQIPIDLPFLITLILISLLRSFIIL